MNKVWIVAMSVVLSMMILVGCTMTAYADMPTYDYTMMTVVVGIEWDADTLYIVCMDGAGDLWVFDDCDEWHIGDVVKLYMTIGENPATYEDDEIDGWEYKSTMSLRDMAKWILEATEG